MVERVVLNALEIRPCRQIFAVCPHQKADSCAFGDDHRLEDKTIHLDQHYRLTAASLDFSLQVLRSLTRLVANEENNSQ